MKHFIANHRRLCGFILLGLAFALVPLWVKSPYYIDLLIVVMINAALAMTFVMMLRTGLISLCIAAFWGIGAYASAMLAIHGHLSFWLSLPLATLITAAFAFVIEDMSTDEALDCGRYQHQDCLWGAIAALNGLAVLPGNLQSPKSEQVVKRLAERLLETEYDFTGEHKRWLTFGVP